MLLLLGLMGREQTPLLIPELYRKRLALQSIGQVQLSGTPLKLEQIVSLEDRIYPCQLTEASIISQHQAEGEQRFAEGEVAVFIAVDPQVHVVDEKRPRGDRFQLVE